MQSFRVRRSESTQSSLTKQSKRKMTKRATGNDLLLPWILMALNSELYSGLRWENKAKRIFRLDWTHRSAEKWNSKALEVFKAWALHKGNNYEKEKDLKSTFRCALNSKKKELKLLKKDKTHRYWQIIDPPTTEEKPSTSKAPKRTGRGRRPRSKNATASVPVPNETPMQPQEHAFPSEAGTSKLSDMELANELPPFQYSFPWPLNPPTPPHQVSDCIAKTPEPSWSFNNGCATDYNRFTPTTDQSFYSDPTCFSKVTQVEVPHETCSYSFVQQSPPPRVPSYPSAAEPEVIHENSGLSNLDFDNFDNFLLSELIAEAMKDKNEYMEQTDLYINKSSNFQNCTQTSLDQSCTQTRLDRSCTQTRLDQNCTQTSLDQNCTQTRLDQNCCDFNYFFEQQLTSPLGTDDIFNMECSYLQQIVPSM